MTLHTGPGCSISDNGGMSGQISTSICDVNAEGQSKNAGCQISTGNTQTYGSGFNSNKGGVYATEWTSSAIKIYFFPRGSIPLDILSGSPTPSSWGTPIASFQGGCDISKTFSEQQIVFDTTFCGDWAGNSWSSSSCSVKADTCNSYVQNNPNAFSDAYWTINSLKVYQSNYVSSIIATPSHTSSSFALWSITSASGSWVEPSSSTVDLTTFAFSAKPSVIPSTFSHHHSTMAPNATVMFSTGNATHVSIPTGSGTAVSVSPASDAAADAITSSSSVSAVVATTSPPKNALSSSQAVASVTGVTVSSTAVETRSTETDRTWSWHSHGGHWGNEANGYDKRRTRHLRQHKRHTSEY
jgi:hypothetical protein